MSHKRWTATPARKHLRANAVSYVALVLALSGAAYSANGSLPGKNTVGSADIMDGEVKSPDVGTDQIRSAHVRNDDLTAGGLTTDDVAHGALTGSDLAGDSLGSLHFFNSTLVGDNFSAGSLTTDDVNEPSLDKVPSASVADGAGTGRNASPVLDEWGRDVCGPESADFLECVSVNPTLATPGRVLVVATVTAGTGFGADTALGSCRLVVNGNAYLTSTTNFDEDDTSDNDFTNADYVRDDATLIAVTDVLPAGDNSVVLECNQGPVGWIEYFSPRISTMTLSPN